MIRTYTCQEHVYIYAGVEAYGGQRATGTNSHGSKRHELVRYLFHGLSPTLNTGMGANGGRKLIISLLQS